MKRTSRRYVVTTSALNCYGYRVLTQGVDYTQYSKNPILLWMHQRAMGNSKDQILPLGRAVDFKLEGDSITCALEFDETDEFAVQVYNKYENETLNMVSLGAIPIEITEDPAQMVAGQTGPTVTKCKMTDLSCVDMGGNDEACAVQLYDENENKIGLSGLVQLINTLQQTPNDDKMKLIQLTGEAFNKIMLALKMDEAATETDVAKKVADLVQLSADQGTKIVQLTADKDAAELKATTAENKVKELEKAEGEAKVIKLVDDHAKKFLPGQRDSFIKLATDNFETTKALLEGMAPLLSVKEMVDQNKGKNGTDYAALSYDEMDRKGLLIKLKAENTELFKEKYQERFGREYTGE